MNSGFHFHWNPKTAPALLSISMLMAMFMKRVFAEEGRAQEVLPLGNAVPVLYGLIVYFVSLVIRIVQKPRI